MNKSRESPPKSKQLSERDIIRQIRQLIDEEESRRDSKVLKMVKDKLSSLSVLSSRKERKLQRLEEKFERMKQVMDNVIVERRESRVGGEGREK